MAKLPYQCSMSLDGFIAGPGGDMSWLVDYLGPDSAIDELIGEVGALLIGNRTFRGDDPHKETESAGEPYGCGWSGPQFVLTHHAPDTPVPGITFVGDLESGIAAATAARPPVPRGGAARRDLRRHRSDPARRRCAPVRPPGRGRRPARAAPPERSAAGDQSRAARAELTHPAPDRPRV